MPSVIDSIHRRTQAAVDITSKLLLACRVQPRGVEIAQSLKIDKSLAWHLAKVASARHPATVIEHLPGLEGIELIVKAASKLNAPDATINEFRDVFSSLLEMQDLIAGDRHVLIGMLKDSPGAEPAVAKSLHLARKSACRANATLFGLSAAAEFRVDCLWLDAATSKLALATIRGWTQLARLRDDAIIKLGAFHLANSPSTLDQPRPLDPIAAAKFQAPVVGEFCSPSLSPFMVDQDSRGLNALFIAQGDLGLSSAVDIVLGEAIGPSISPFAQQPGELAEVFVRCHIPTRRLVHDWLIHRDLLAGAWKGQTPHHDVWSELSGGGLFPLNRSHKSRLSPRTAIARSAVPEHAVRIPELPRHLDMIKWLCNSQSLTIGDFDLYRVEIEHPITPSTSVMSIPLPQPRD